MSQGQSSDCPSRAPQPVLSRSVSPSLIVTSSIYSPALSLMIEGIYRAQSRGFQLISFLFLPLREASLASVSLGFRVVLCSVHHLSSLWSSVAHHNLRAARPAAWPQRWIRSLPLVMAYFCNLPQKAGYSAPIIITQFL